MVASREKTQAQVINGQEAKCLAVMGQTMPDAAVKMSAALNDTSKKTRWLLNCSFSIVTHHFWYPFLSSIVNTYERHIPSRSTLPLEPSIGRKERGREILVRKCGISLAHSDRSMCDPAMRRLTLERRTKVMDYVP